MVNAVYLNLCSANICLTKVVFVTGMVILRQKKSESFILVKEMHILQVQNHSIKEMYMPLHTGFFFKKKYSFPLI